MLEYLQSEKITENKRRILKRAGGEKKRQRRALLAGILFAVVSALGLAACGQTGESNKEGGKEETDMERKDQMDRTEESAQVQGNVQNGEQKEKALLHYILPEGYEYRYIGDVHPFYDEKSGKWFLYYLDTSGQFHSRLLTSKDGVSWEPVELTSKSSMANYGVLGIVQWEDKYYSYYGDYHTNVSEDLINWEYAGKRFQAFQDKEQFPGGCRDPFVAYDEETERFYSVAINYVRRVPGEGIFDANLAIGRTASRSLEDWSKEAKPVFAETNDNHDPECPQLLKIGNRWYVFTSFYGFSRHGVGRLAYLIGDEGMDPYSVDWTAKEIHYLTSEDICAAQVAPKGDAFYLFGWIPKQYDAGFWGGHVNLPTQVYQLEDGLLGARMDEETTDLIRGERYFELDSAKDVRPGSSVALTAAKRCDIEVDFLLEGETLTLDYAEKKLQIEITKKEGKGVAKVIFNHMTLSEMELDEEQLESRGTIRIISEADMLEIYMNNRYYMPARIGVKLGEEQISIESDAATIYRAEAYCLKTAQEVKAQ